MAKTTIIAAALVLVSLAVPTALAFDVIGSVDATGTYAEARLAGITATWSSAPSEEPPAQEREARASSTLVVSTPLASAAVALLVDAAPLAPVLVPLPPDAVEVLHVAPLAPARAPAAAPAPAARAAEPAPAFVPLIVPPEPPVPVVAVAAGAATVAAAGAASAGATLWERLRRAGAAGAALLYSRIARERLLDHGARERLLETIRARPGLAVADLAEATGIPRNTATYHLRVLEREGLASSQREGRNRLYFAPGALPQKQNAEALSTLRHETTLAVAKAIGATPGLDQKALCQQIGVSPSLAHWHADRLVATGVVDKRREGRSVRYYPGTAFTVVASRS